MERKELVPAVLAGALLALLLNRKKDITTIAIEIVAGVSTAFFLAPYIVGYFNFPESITAFGIGTASSKICLSLYKYFGDKTPIEIIIQQNSDVSESAEGLDANK